MHQSTVSDTHNNNKTWRYMSELQLNKYQSGAVSTAIYPGTMVYPALGLCGEVGELIAAVTEDRYSGECSDALVNASMPLTAVTESMHL